MEKASKNIYVGEPISDLREIGRLSKEGKSIVQRVRYPNRKYIVRPASFYLHWPLRMLLMYEFYYSVKL